METCNLYPTQYSSSAVPLVNASAMTAIIKKYRLAEWMNVDNSRNTMISFKTASKPNSEYANWVKAVAENKDRKAFKALFDEFAPRVRSFILRKGTDAALADEVTQEAMVNVWRKAAQFNPSKASVSTWIFTIARNMRIDMLRKMHRPEPDMNDPCSAVNTNPNIVDKIAIDEDAKRLKLAFAMLPEDQRLVLNMSFYEEKAHGQIAADLGIPLGTVKSRIRLAFKKLRKELGENKWQ